MEKVKKGPYACFFKRILDILISFLFIAFFWWLYAVLAILVRAKLGAPIIFKQERPGIINPKTGKETIFQLYKFRTMTDEKDDQGNLLPDEIRLTSFGSWLRKTSLDELPEMINILKGEMSLVGPRPLLVKYLERYNKEQHHRHDVRPGLTGYAQAHGRNAISWEEKFAMDVWYTQNVTFVNDLKIILDTVKTVVKKEGISSGTSATMEEFMGSAETEENGGKKMNDLIIFGAGGFGREIAWVVERINNISKTWNLLGFFDDNDSIQGAVINGYRVLGKTEDVDRYPDAYYVCAIGSAKIREKKVNELKANNRSIKFGTIIDPAAILSDRISIGEGTIICAHSVITVNIDIGEHVIINLDCMIGHDAILNDFVTLYPSVNISGATNIGRCSELGTGVQIIQGKSVGDYTIVGAGAVIVRDLPGKCTAVGCPARAIKFE